MQSHNDRQMIVHENRSYLNFAPFVMREEVPRSGGGIAEFCGETIWLWELREIFSLVEQGRWEEVEVDSRCMEGWYQSRLSVPSSFSSITILGGAHELLRLAWVASLHLSQPYLPQV